MRCADKNEFDQYLISKSRTSKTKQIEFRRQFVRSSRKKIGFFHAHFGVKKSVKAGDTFKSQLKREVISEN